MSRYTVRTAVVDALRTALATAGVDSGQVQVELGWPGDQIQPESVWLEGSDGTVDYPIFHGTVTHANRLTRQDEYQIPVQIRACRAGQSLDDAEYRAQFLFDLCDTALAGDPTLRDLPGIVKATLGEVNGPATGRMESGAQSFYRFVIEVQARTT